MCKFEGLIELFWECDVMLQDVLVQALQKSRTELLLQAVKDLVARQHLRHTRVRLAAFLDGCKELSVLQLNAIH
jgi:hypothetical protein